MPSVLADPRFRDEAAAYAWVESRVWPDGPVCPHCRETKRIHRIKPNPTRKVRLGLYACGACRKQFTVKVGTVFESSHVPMHVWLQAMHLMCSSKKGISSNQLHRLLGVTLKTAWFMSHRIREAMRTGGLDPLGGAGGIVEADETYYGKAENPRPRRASLPPPTKGGRSGPAGKRPVVALVERGGAVRTFHVERADKATVAGLVRQNVARESRLMTDESKLYMEVGGEMAGHETVCHSAEEYVRGDVHTNTIEGYFSIFKRGMRGVYQHCAEKHLHRYLAEFDFRYNNRVRLGVDDATRADRALAGVKGKRLTYANPVGRR